MGLYEHLAPVYDSIFPVSEAALAFIEGLGRTNLPGRNLVDLGSATGGHAFALLERGWKVRGIELSPELLAIARQKRAENGALVDFIEADMRDLNLYLGAGSVDLFLCLGNTLPHLGGLEEIGSFFEKARSALSIGGKIVLQIVNFEVAGPGYVFPTARTERYRFERSYQALSGGKLAFDTLIDLGEKGSFSDRTE
ncbi:MAG TPA: class I SAM-dependent methyltransferase, partial [Rectinemataceae bacterium]|nr:class I SAM-dependent methyltransferase [Rectinemataceae bacterium]